MPLEPRKEKPGDKKGNTGGKISLKDIMGDIEPSTSLKKEAAKKTTAKKTNTKKEPSTVSVPLDSVESNIKSPSEGKGFFDNDLTTPTETTSEFEWTPQNNPFDIQNSNSNNPFESKGEEKTSDVFALPPQSQPQQQQFTQPQQQQFTQPQQQQFTQPQQQQFTQPPQPQQQQFTQLSQFVQQPLQQPQSTFSTNPFEIRNQYQPAPSSGFMFQPLGVELEKHELTRTRFSEKWVYRGTIPFTDRMGVARYHYDKRVGTFFCFGGNCCKKYNTNVRVVLPWISYNTDKKGSVTNKDIHCGFLQLTEDDYNEQIRPYALNGNISDFDYQVICIEEKYQKMVFNQLPGNCFWKLDNTVAQEVVDKFTKLWGTVHQAIAKTLSEEELIEAFSASNYNPEPDYPQVDLNRFQKRG